ncbi:MAG: YbjN domain-containing protein [Paracoccaceae bacterium]|nr:YbjN domain-containing protein [Paracoccaceae bacterium]
MTMKFKAHIIGLTFAGLLFTQQAVAGPTSVSAAYPDSIITALQDLGYKAELTTDSYGDPMIRSAANGVGFALNFYGCENGELCTDLQFSVAFDDPEGMSFISMNSWNVEKVMGTAFLDDKNDPVLQHFVSQVDGMSRSNFDATFNAWVEALGQFTDYIDW